MSDKLCVLLVDDDHKMVKTLIDILKFKGYEVKAASSALEALEKMAETQFDCVLSDIKMPDLNGVELYRAIKARQPDLPVILMTAIGEETGMDFKPKDDSDRELMHADAFLDKEPRPRRFDADDQHAQGH